MNEDRKDTAAPRYGVELVAGLTIFTVSLYVIRKSIEFWKEDFVDVFYYSSGLMPMILGICLLVFSGLYVARTLRAHSFQACLLDLQDFLKAFVKDRNMHKSIIGIAIIWVYIYCLLGRVPFWLATCGTLAVLLVFVNEHKDPKHILKLSLVSAGATFMIILVFQVIFHVPMP